MGFISGLYDTKIPLKPAPGQSPKWGIFFTFRFLNYFALNYPHYKMNHYHVTLSGLLNSFFRLPFEPVRKLRKSRVCLSVAFFLGYGVSVLGQIAPQEIGNLQEHLLIHKTGVYTDSTNTLTVQSLYKNTNQYHFRKIENYGVAVSSGNYNTWIHFKLSNRSGKTREVVFEIPISRMDSFEVFSVDAREGIKYWGKCYGTGFPVSRKPLRSLSHAIAYHLGPGSVEDIYINIRRFPYTIVNNVRIYDANAFLSFESVKHSKLAFIYGLYLLELIICLAFYIALARKYLLLFILTITVKVWFVSYIFGIFSFYELDFIATNGIIFLIMIFQYWYFKLFFALPYSRWFILSLFLLWGLHAAFYPFFKDKNFDYSLIMSISTLILTGIFIYEIAGVIRKGYKSATLFLISQLPAIFSILLNAFNSIAGYITRFYRENDYDILYYNTVIELFIFAVVLVERLWRLNKERLYYFKEISTLQTEVIETQETERRKIATDLHDDLGSTLALLKDNIEKGNGNPKEVVKKAIRDLRSISHQLMPQEFESAGFRAALERFVTQPGGDPKINLVFFGKNERVTQGAELNIYRVITELIHNARKHGKAAEINLQLTYRPDVLHIAYEEAGNVMPENAKAGLGLQSIQTRLQYLNARILENGNGPDGYVFVAEIPLGTTI